MPNTINTHHRDCRFASGSGWCCAPQCGRPIIPMVGRVMAAFVTASDDSRHYSVEIWVQSSGESDSLIFRIPCQSYEQADTIAMMWQIRWSLSDGDGSVPATRGTVANATPMA